MSETAEYQAIWDNIEESLENSLLLNEYGFSNRNEIENNLVVLVAGDLVHPELGLNYVKLAADGSNHAQVLKAVKKRDRFVANLLQSVISTFNEKGLAEAEKLTATSTKVLYLCRSIDEIRAAIESMQQQGLAALSFCDESISRVGNSLVFVFEEEYSYFVFDD